MDVHRLVAALRLQGVEPRRAKRKTIHCAHTSTLSFTALRRAGRSHFDCAQCFAGRPSTPLRTVLRSGLEEVFDEFFVDAGEVREFLDGDEFVTGFAEGFSYFLNEAAGGTASAAGNVFNIFRVKDYPLRQFVIVWIHSSKLV